VVVTVVVAVISAAAAVVAAAVVVVVVVVAITVDVARVLPQWCDRMKYSWRVCQKWGLVSTITTMETIDWKSIHARQTGKVRSRNCKA
jgi:hypothetical protein